TATIPHPMRAKTTAAPNGRSFPGFGLAIFRIPPGFQQSTPAEPPPASRYFPKQFRVGGVTPSGGRSRWKKSASREVVVRLGFPIQGDYCVAWFGHTERPSLLLPTLTAPGLIR